MKKTVLFALVLCFGVHLRVGIADEVAPATGTEKSPITWYQPDKWRSLGSVGFRLAKFPKDSFVLLFPEWITAREMDWHVDTEWEFDGETARGTWKADAYALELEMKFASSGDELQLVWELVFRNGSDTPLTDVSAFNCFNLVDAPSFRDLEMKRTTVRQKNDQGVVIESIAKTKGPRPLQFYAARGGLPLTEFERFMRYQATSSAELAGDRIGVRSKDGKWEVRNIVEGQVAFFFNNWEETHGCIHAAPLLGTIPPGKSGAAQGRIVFTPQAAP